MFNCRLTCIMYNIDNVYNSLFGTWAIHFVVFILVKKSLIFNDSIFQINAFKFYIVIFIHPKLQKGLYSHNTLNTIMVL